MSTSWWRRRRQGTQPSLAEGTTSGSASSSPHSPALVVEDGYEIEGTEISQDAKWQGAPVTLTIYLYATDVQWYISSMVFGHGMHQYGGLVLPRGPLHTATGSGNHDEDEDSEPTVEALAARAWAVRLYNQVLRGDRTGLVKALSEAGAAELTVHREQVEGARARLAATEEELRELECTLLLARDLPVEVHEVIAGLLPEWGGSATELEAAARSMRAC